VGRRVASFLFVLRNNRLFVQTADYYTIIRVCTRILPMYKGYVHARALEYSHC